VTEQLIALVPVYGLGLLSLIVFLSCLALPVPSSLVMLTCGSFVAAGDLGMVSTFGAAWGAAMAGDQTGYLIGRKGGGRLLDALSRHKDRAALLEKARHYVKTKGGPGVFLSRWLFSPLGPYVNFIGGATGLGWTRFTFWGALGELVWVSLYVGLGILFADNISAAAELATDFLGILAAGFVALFLGMRLFRVLRHPKHSA
jgi:membrane-associated protein